VCRCSVVCSVCKDAHSLFTPTVSRGARTPRHRRYITGPSYALPREAGIQAGMLFLPAQAPPPPQRACVAAASSAQTGSYCAVGSARCRKAAVDAPQRQPPVPARRASGIAGEQALPRRRVQQPGRAARARAPAARRLCRGAENTEREMAAKDGRRRQVSEASSSRTVVDAGARPRYKEDARHGRHAGIEAVRHRWRQHSGSNNMRWRAQPACVWVWW